MKPVTSYPSGLDTCRHCGTYLREEQHPVKLSRGRDRERWLQAGLRCEKLAGHHVVWIPRYHCDCSWKAQLRGVHTDLIAALLPDPLAEREIRRRAATGRRP